MNVVEFVQQSLTPCQKHGDNWYTCGGGRINASKADGFEFVGVYTNKGNGTLYNPSMTDFRRVCEIYGVELPPSPDEVFDEHSPVSPPATSDVVQQMDDDERMDVNGNWLVHGRCDDCGKPDGPEHKCNLANHL